MNVIELLLLNGIAENSFSASHIATGLKLYECKTDDEKLERAKLYRRWRSKRSKDKQVSSKQAYYLTINNLTPEDVESMIKYSCSGRSEKP